jgi:predicted permease
MLPNAANYGLSANLLAFGPDGLTYAGVYFVTSAVITFTVGVLVASLGRAGVGEALRGLLRVPAIWGVAAAALVQGGGLHVPAPLSRAVGMLADACIPAFLVILGMQLHGVRLSGPALPLAVAGGLRLVGGAALALALAPWFGLEGAARQSGVLQSAMPTAVITIVLATEYDVEPALVTSVVMLTTLASPLVLTPLMALLGAG